ncbi:MAG: hypothetical protein FJY54_15175 [Betaproteobacteria bacterium]|nr:hypothetical protein [Betaproteobacteria bacterium]
MPRATSAPASGDAGSAVSGGVANGSASGEGSASSGARPNLAALEQGVIAATQHNERDVRQLPTCR